MTAKNKSDEILELARGTLTTPFVVGSPEAMRYAIGIDSTDPKQLSLLQLEPVIECDQDEDPVRHELAAEADINTLMRRYLDPRDAYARAPLYGDVDMDVDMTQMLEDVRQVRRAWHELDPNLRRLYPSWVQLFQAAERGDIALIEGKIKRKEEIPPPPAPPPTN